MSRSRKKVPIYKDRGFRKDSYWKTVRRRYKTIIKGNRDEESLQFPNPKTIVNDYDYCDWLSDCRYKDNCYCIRTFGRKKCIQK